MNIITLTTDFGLADWFVGTMKGVMLAINPRVSLVDVTHGIPAGNIRAGAFVLAAGFQFFPQRTIHVAVVDPGVGTQRRILAVQTDRFVFLGPDNGVLSLALARQKPVAIHLVTNTRFFLKPVSQTFHGRDVYAPAAAHLSTGIPLRKLGPPIEDFVRLEWPQPLIDQGEITGEVLYIDGFGNGITNITNSALSTFDPANCEVFLRRKRLCRVRASYQSVPLGKPVAVVGSAGLLEIAVNCGSAGKSFRLKIGDLATVRQKRP